MNQNENKTEQTQNGVMGNLKHIAASFSGENNDIEKSLKKISELRKRIGLLEANLAGKNEAKQTQKPIANKKSIKTFVPQQQNGVDNSSQRFNRYDNSRSSYNNGPRPTYNNNGTRPAYNNNGTRPAYNNNGTRPAYNNNAPRPAYNNNGTRPAYNNNGTRPAYNNNGTRPAYNNNGTRPAYNNNGTRPAYNNGQRPYSPRPQSFTDKVLGGKNDLKDSATVLSTNKTGYTATKAKDTYKKKNERTVKSKRTLIRMGYIQPEDYSNRANSRRSKTNKKPRMQETIIMKPVEHAVIDTNNLTVKILSEKMGKSVSEIIKKFMLLDMMVTINTQISFDDAQLIAEEFSITLEQKVAKNNEEILAEKFTEEEKDNEKDYVKRAPVVTIMGHVDHGKTSLLDTIRNTNVVSGEAGGITQHIGAYTINWRGESITFIDTPGHAAFAAMRARGAKVTDIAILVVAADDGVMPQTIESIKYIKEAKIPMIVAVNKIDKPNADVDKIKQQLADYEVLCEDWGGDVVMVPISAKNNLNIDKLLEMVTLVAEVQDLKANPKRKGVGTVIEAKLDKGRGAVATVLVSNGTIQLGDTIVCGMAMAKVKALIDDKGKRIKSAGPSTPVEILGFNEAPQAGDISYVVDEKFAKQLLSERKAKSQNSMNSTTKVDFEKFLDSNPNSAKKNYNVIIKGDVQGSVEALRDSLKDVNNEEVNVACVTSGVGAISESDIDLAEASEAVIIAFNTKTNSKIQKYADKAKVYIMSYAVIYKVVEDLQDIIDKMLTPKFKEVPVGVAEVRAVFKLSTSGLIAGSYVLSGKITRNAKVRVMRNNEEVANTDITTLKIIKNDVKEVTTGVECGIKIADFDTIQVGDRLEAYVLELIKNKK